MTTLENAISIPKILQCPNTGCPFPLKSQEDIYRDLEISRHQIETGNYQDAREFIAEVRKDYGI